MNKLNLWKIIFHVIINVATTILESLSRPQKEERTKLQRPSERGRTEDPNHVKTGQGSLTNHPAPFVLKSEVRGFEH